ncbi:MAG TPA: glycosyltransferase family 4 protein [Acidimicrobiales bacterium]|nr:glycosyltransferase family 4 protein [Acidimicrobiales bacterium]
MRIGLIAPPWLAVPPKGYGGTEAVIDALARGIAAEGHEVVLFATGDSTCPVPTEWVYAEGQDAGIGSGVVEMRHVVHAYEALRGVDLIHDHTVLGPLYAQWHPEAPVVTTHHSRFTEDFVDLFRIVAARAHVVAISHSQASHAGDVPIDRVIHHGIDVDDYPYGTGRGGYLLFLGRMSADKGPRRAIVAAREAGMPLRIAAKMREPGEFEYFESQVKPLLAGDIEYVGEVDARAKIELLADATALVNPIRWDEPFGLVMVEALACGTPVLTFAEGAAPEIVDDGVTGFVCRDELELGRRAREVHLLDRRACRTVASQRFSAQRMVRDHLALYAEVLEKG